MYSLLWSLWLVLAVACHNGSAYTWQLFQDDTVDLCAGAGGAATCDGAPNLLCDQFEAPHPRCVQAKYKPIDLSGKVAQILNGHNGLRNRAAKAFRKAATNMNYLHWDPDLARMAQRWVQQCNIGTDPCRKIYNATFTVGQNILFQEQFNERMFVITTIRSWFLEGNRLPRAVLGDYKPHATYADVGAPTTDNYTQLIWARTEFVGCAAANLQDGVFMVCNYSPAGNLAGRRVYAAGRRPCTRCKDSRPSCSRIFSGLCGMDDPRAGGSRQAVARDVTLLLGIVVVVVVAAVAVRWPV